MNILKDDNFNEKSAVVIGKFDGVHKGHQQLLKLAAEISQKQGLTPIAYTFSSEHEKSRILSDAEKTELLSQNGIKSVYLQHLTEDFKNTSPQEFVRLLKNNFSAQHIIVGFNFRFGKGRSADASDMVSICEENGISATVAEPVMFCGKPISSTRIRSEILSGNMENVFAMMGRRLKISAKVIKGKQLGREIGFPTANLDITNIHLIPRTGVYATKVIIDSRVFAAVTNIGSNPTVDKDGSIKIETHIIGFYDCLYGKNITVEFLQFLRDEEQFVSLSHLSSQLESDCENSVKIFKNNITL